MNHQTIIFFFKKKKGKNVSWLAGSATRAQLNRAQALRENLGDVTGKAGSQATAAGLAGTPLSVCALFPF